MTETHAALIDAVERAQRLLSDYGDVHVAARLSAIVQALRRGEKWAPENALAEATGGMGSLNDRFLHPANGDQLRPDEIEAINARLQNLVKIIEREARSAAP